MYNFLKKHIQLSFVIFFFFTTSIQCSEQPWYKKWYEDLVNDFFNEGLAYERSVLTTDLMIALRQMVYRPVMSINPDFFIKICRNNLVQHEKHIRADLQEQFYVIAKEHDLSEADINTGLELIDKVRLAYLKSYMSKSNVKITHDKNIPLENFTTLKEVLSQGNIDINNICIKNSDIHSVVPNKFAECVYAVDYGYEIEDDELFSVNYTNVQPITIVFYPRFYLLDKYEQQATCIHEATHLLEGHGIIKGLVCNFIADSVHKDVNEVKESENFQKFVHICERQAEVLPSLKKKNAATLMRDMRNKYYSDEMPYVQHYSQLSDIEETHKMIAYLESVKKYRRKLMPCSQKIRSKFDFDLKNAHLVEQPNLVLLKAQINAGHSKRKMFALALIE